ncbi:hypothetical protein [Macrococcus sp. DPC7161]|uniref:hypothetical protein n=1 Tax=Macrococcus sp. DPC7161 TaxID=2507060 RepID=UPI00100AAE40|nr:hypothetical protein [Macrococcus sp. DPC7161]RXK19029.1 hypothetical protein ER639_01580 [Macrococcus sp. DPC7161]
MNSNWKSNLSMSAIIMTSALLFTACDDNTSEKAAPKSSDDGVKKYDLVYAEVLNNGDDETMSMEVGFKNNKTVKSKRFDTENVVEHILKDQKEKPYVMIDGEEVHIFRHPYVVYDQEDGYDTTVEDKAVVK